MPLFDFKCRNCKFRKEHFVFKSSDKLQCPKCSSTEYIRQFSSFRLNVEYSNNLEHIEKKLKPELDDLYRQIGREALQEDSKTLDNLFGETQVRETYGPEDD